MFQDLTIRTRLGAVDLVPFLRRDEGATGVEVREWERRPAALALTERGWHPERIAYATGLRVTDVQETLDGWAPPAPGPKRISPALYQKGLRARRLAERVLVDGHLVHPDAKHGTPAGVKHYGCNCGPCRATKRAAP
jgi:hypothetical protein